MKASPKGGSSLGGLLTPTKPGQGAERIPRESADLSVKALVLGQELVGHG